MQFEWNISQNNVVRSTFVHKEMVDGQSPSLHVDFHKLQYPQVRLYINLIFALNDREAHNLCKRRTFLRGTKTVAPLLRSLDEKQVGIII